MVLLERKSPILPTWHLCPVHNWGNLCNPYKKIKNKAIGWKIGKGPHKYASKGEIAPPLWLGEILRNNPTPQFLELLH